MLASNSDVNLIKKYLENNRLLTSCGKFSFGIYLLHFLIFFSFKEVVFLEAVIYELKSCYVYGLVVLVAYVLGFFWYHSVEKHCIKIANKLCNRIDEMNSIIGI